MAGTVLASTIKHDVSGAAPVIRDGAGTEIGQFTKAWMSYNGVTPTTRSSFNISSVTKSSTGNYTPSFTISFADTNYTFAGSVNMYSGGYISAVVQPTSPVISTSSVLLVAINYISGGSYFDASYFLVNFNR